MIYTIKQEGLYQNKVNSCLISTWNCKVAYCYRNEKKLIDARKIGFLGLKFDVWQEQNQ